MTDIRNRIVEHLQVRAGDLVPHPLNYHTHPDAQRRALADSYRTVGFARSLLGYRLADGRIQLIDGHLRRDLTPDLPVTVEVLDVTEDEARQLLLTLDPLAALAQNTGDTLAELRRQTATDSEALRCLWDSLTEDAAALENLRQRVEEAAAEQFLILIECGGEPEQVALLERFRAEGLKCKALVS